MPRRSLLATVLVIAPLAACSRAGDHLPTFAAAGPSAAPPLAEQVAPTQALATLPAEAGAVVSVVERRSDHGLTQTITLAGDGAAQGDDRIVVTTRERNGKFDRRASVDETAVAEEIAEILPGVAMSVSPRVHTAGALPLGIATGRTAGGFTCLYAWSDTTARRRGDRTALDWLDGDRSADLSLRLRLCRRGLGEDRMIALAEGLSLRTDVATRRDGPVIGRPAGRDALETAGYGGTVAAAPAQRPTWSTPAWSTPVVASAPPSAPTPRRVVSTTPARVHHTATPVAAAPLAPDPAIPPIPTTADAARMRTSAAPVAAPPIAAPIAAAPTPSTPAAGAVPLPSGG